MTDSVGRTRGCVQLLACFQPTQGQLGSNRDATITLSPPAFSLRSLLPFRFSGFPFFFLVFCCVGGRVSGVLFNWWNFVFSTLHQLKHSTAVLWNGYDSAQVLNLSRYGWPFRMPISIMQNLFVFLFSPVGVKKTNPLSLHLKSATQGKICGNDAVSLVIWVKIQGQYKTKAQERQCIMISNNAGATFIVGFEPSFSLKRLMCNTSCRPIER